MNERHRNSAATSISVFMGLLLSWVTPFQSGCAYFPGLHRRAVRHGSSLLLGATSTNPPDGGQAALGGRAVSAKRLPVPDEFEIEAVAALVAIGESGVAFSRRSAVGGFTLIPSFDLSLLKHNAPAGETRV